MKEAHHNGTRMLALTLGLLLMLAPLSAFASDRALEYVAVAGDKKGYSEKANAPKGGQKENEHVEGTNPLTGEQWSGTYQPILINIDTDPLARPNYGVSDADIIYELPLHRQGNTRSVALFMGTYPAGGAGPVRSARIPMVDIAEEWGAGYVFFGMQESKGTSVKDYIKTLHKNGGSQTWPYLDLMAGKFKEMSERTNYPNPHNVRANVAQIVSELAKDTPKMRPWKFSDAGLDRGASAYFMSIEFRPDAIPSFRYNEETKSYDRFYNGEAYVDANSNKQCSFANVIVMRTKVEWYRNNPSRPVVALTGSGDAEIFMSGRYIRGSWSRDGVGGRTVFMDENGEEISFLPGKTFIHIIDNEQDIVIGNDPSEGDALQNGKPVPTPKPTKTPKPTRTPRPTRTPKPGSGDAVVTPAPAGEDGGEVELPAE